MWFLLIFILQTTPAGVENLIVTKIPMPNELICAAMIPTVKVVELNPLGSMKYNGAICTRQVEKVAI